MLAKLIEPIRIVTKSTPLGVTAAAALMGLFSFLDFRSSVRVILRYTSEELSALAHEDYQTFIFIDCVEKSFRDRFVDRKTFFVSSMEAYTFGLSYSPEMVRFGAFFAAGQVADCLSYHEQLQCADTYLQAGLQAGVFHPDSKSAVIELTQDFYNELRMTIAGKPMKLIDIGLLLTACTRVGKASSAVAALLGDTAALDDCIKALNDHKTELKRALAWCKQNESATHKLAGVLVIHAKDYVASYLTGSVAAHIAQEVQKGTLVLVLAHATDHTVRVSLRMSGRRDEMSMVDLIGQIFESIEGEYGGDMIAAGGSFKKSEEEKFLSAARKVLEQAFVEERV